MGSHPTDAHPPEARAGEAASQLRGLASGAPNLSPCVLPLPGKSGIWPGGDCPRTRSRTWVVGWSPPHPPVWTVILGPAYLQNPASKRAEFLRFFGACGAASRGGGGAPPTTLILLRNQRQLRSRPRTARRRGLAGPPGGRPGPQAASRAPKCQILPFLLFCSSC